MIEDQSGKFSCSVYTDTESITSVPVFRRDYPVPTTDGEYPAYDHWCDFVAVSEGTISELRASAHAKNVSNDEFEFSATSQLAHKMPTL